MKLLKSVLVATALALATSTAAMAQRTDVVIGMVLEPPHLDPTAGAAAAIKEVGYANVFEGLTRIGPDGSVQPGLAESWEISDDGKVYTFKLHTGVKFHDGADFSAEDVKFSIDRAMAEDSVNPQKGLYSAIQSVEVVDSATVVVNLKHPQGAFLWNMGWGEAAIVSPASADGNKERPIGTGPFKFDNWAKGSSITLVKNPDYWGEEVALDRAEFRIIPDSAAAIPALLSGDVHAFSNMPVGDALPQIESDPRFKVVIGSTEGETVLSTNNKKEPFDKLEVRQAIAHALNREEIIQGVPPGLGVPIGSHFAPHHPAYIDLTGTYPYDPEKAKELLAQAGLPDGFSATLKLPPPSYARDGGQIIASQLRQVGINLEIIPLEWADWLSQVFTDKNYDLSIVSHVEPMDIGIYARPDYYFQYENPEFNAVMEELEVTTDEAKRNELYGKAQTILAQDAAVGFLFQLPKIGVWDAKLEGMWENWPLSVADLTKVHWTE
ncbi:ABC transporter substrate-binding protein [Mesorhizobium microcysteis]|uniref:ABC transporter substrate-binding protein n=1 Tax=Neoaquamicrobium microcysteis TaxID=2682781 RepID=A0A5D4GVN9_9HYPH|nr:ABC transporter substrate-binding protein [Mesorhizobium microcysteis]TYR32448.1 ABC transporter substrate-binding protein [Mesorhizobium microcysteis]